jgi:hypothetical protein
MNGLDFLEVLARKSHWTLTLTPVRYLTKSTKVPLRGGAAASMLRDGGGQGADCAILLPPASHWSERHRQERRHCLPVQPVIKRASVANFDAPIADRSCGVSISPRPQSSVREDEKGEALILASETIFRKLLSVEKKKRAFGPPFHPHARAFPELSPYRGRNFARDNASAFHDQSGNRFTRLV